MAFFFYSVLLPTVNDTRKCEKKKALKSLINHKYITYQND